MVRTPALHLCLLEIGLDILEIGLAIQVVLSYKTITVDNSVARECDCKLKLLMLGCDVK